MADSQLPIVTIRNVTKTFLQQGQTFTALRDANILRYPKASSSP